MMHFTQFEYAVFSGYMCSIKESTEGIYFLGYFFKCA